MGRDTVSIRRMARSDIDAILELHKKVGGGRSLISYRDMVATDPGGPLDLSFIAEAGGQVIGFMLARLVYQGIPFSEVCIIHALVIDSEYQRRGIGGKLVNALLDYCYTEQINTIRAIFEEANTELRRFVERLGFRRSIMINYDKTFDS